jgi:hypothetical protein
MGNRIFDEWQDRLTEADWQRIAEYVVRNDTEATRAFEAMSAEEPMTFDQVDAVYGALVEITRTLGSGGQESYPNLFALTAALAARLPEYVTFR